MADWFTYDWQYEGEDAVFRVDLSLEPETQAEEFPFLFRLDCRAVKDDSLSARCLRHVDTIEKKLVKQDVLFAGRVDTRSCAQFYLYSRGKETGAALEYICEKEKRLLDCRIDAREDGGWSFYQKFLYPDAAKSQTEENRKLIARIEKLGDNPAAARRIRSHLFFPSEPLAAMFAQQARTAGYAIGESEFIPEMEQPHGVVIVRVCTLEKREVDAMTTQAIRLAVPCQGIFCYWECPRIPKNNPLR